ncbi:cohesin domain-containing protein [Acidicapsa ligni]|uniref:cohesin domain-containing protein n=1 Tax=Acidicapsa ligni TaxID=542300 RepID=UPI0021DF7854|nr:cohesin domain-containing protein [Acidicapsa ligni]
MNRLAIPHKVYRIAAVSLVASTLVLSTISVPVAAAESAKALFNRGQADEAKEDYDGAYEAFKKAYARKPDDLRYRTAFYRLRQIASSDHVTKGRKLLAQGNDNGALEEFLRASSIDPGNEAAIQEVSHLRAHQALLLPKGESSENPTEASPMEDIASPVELKPVSNDPLTLRYSEDAKVVYQAIGKAAGINILFDPDYNSKHVQVDLTNVSLMDALHIVGTMSNTFWRPVTTNTIFVAANSPTKHRDLEEQAVQTFYLSNAWQPNDLNDVQTALRNVLASTTIKIFGVPSQNAIVVRATPDELMMAQKVINDLDKARPEVVVDVAIMEVDKDKLRNIGLSWPGSIGFQLQPPSTSGTSTTTTNADGSTSSTTGSLTLNNLANLNANDFAVTVSAATANLLLTDSEGKILQNPRIRATDGQKATMKIGQRIPIATGSYQTGAATAITSSLVNTQFQYIDVGVNIEMTPTVHYDHDITLKLKIEDSSEANNVTISGVTEPIIAQKTSEQTIRLREGEATVLAGILNKQDLVSTTGIPGLSELPLLKYVFGSKSHEVIDDEIVFVLVPHIVREQEISPLNRRMIDVGTGQTIDLRRVSSTSIAPGSGNPAAKPAAGRPRTSVGGGIGPLTGQTAEAALPSALAQLRKGIDGDVPGKDVAATPATTPVPTPGATPAPAAAVAAAGPPVNFVLQPSSAPLAAGSVFPVQVMLNGAHDVSSAPLQIKYDATKLTLLNVDSGDLLGKDGQAVALVHRDDGPGMITVVASRPPGVPGITGSGSVCVLSFQAKVAGETDLTFARPSALDSAQHQIPTTAQNAHIVVK